MHSRIFLIGFMGSGKSTLGKKLANQLDYRFEDMDDLIVRTSGMTIPGIFSEHGEELFRKWEKDILQEVIKKESLVIATGGGAPCHHDNLDVMNAHGLTVYLQLPPEAIRDRLLNSRTERPLVKGKSGEELLQFIKELLEKREKFYLASRLVVNGMETGASELAEMVRNF